jgi:hypothetical protein
MEFKKNFPKINEPIKKLATELNRTFFKGRNPNGQKNMKKCSPSLSIREMHIKKLHLTPVRISTSNTKTTNVEDAGEKGTLIDSWC